jgi:type I restriction enzyme, S subunit
LYREWFVNFRFPGHEEVEMVDSSLGQIPAGWRSGKFSDLAKIVSSGVNPGNYPQEQFAHYSLPAYDDGKLPKIELGSMIMSNKNVVPKNCVLLSKLNPHIPRVWLPKLDEHYRAIASTEFLALIPSFPVTLSYVYSVLVSESFQKHFANRALGTSTSHQRVKPDNLLSMEVLVPNDSTINLFNNFMTPILGLVSEMRMKNNNLRRTRDLLLPKLISGEIDVSTLEIAGVTSPETATESV